MRSFKLARLLNMALVYLVLSALAFIMLFPFLVMIFTSLKTPSDTFRFPPKLLPYEQQSVVVAGSDEPLPAYWAEIDGRRTETVLIEQGIPAGTFADPANPDQTYQLLLADVAETDTTVVFAGEDTPLFNVTIDGQTVQMVKLSQTVVGRFADVNNLNATTYGNVRTAEPVEQVKFHPENYAEVVSLHAMDRSLTNTALVTFIVVLGQLTTSVLGGYAFARLRFPGRDSLFVLYLGTIMIPFVVLITPLYQLMVMIGWVDRLASLTIPWIFTAYGTFLMRQFFISIPKEIEEAAIIDGASRLEILVRIFLPASTPALAALATFTFLYAWNSFFWPLVVINSGNLDNRVLTLALMVLGGRAADSPNLVLAGAAIAVLPPVLIYIIGQRFFVETSTSSGVKG